MFDILLAEAKKIIRNPKRLGQAFRARRWMQLFSVLRHNPADAAWRPLGSEAGLKQRVYSSYEEYVRHQSSKLKYLDLTEYEATYRRKLAERLRSNSLVHQGSSVLCLGARRGAEVSAFHDLGCFAVGLDLNPGPDNPLVLKGDFHDVQYPTASVDIIFTNCIDHAFDARRFIEEISRLLKPGGLLIVEAIRGESEKVTPDSYASFWWGRIDDLVALFRGHGFEVVQRAPFTDPWPGEHFCLRRKEENGGSKKQAGSI